MSRTPFPCATCDHRSDAVSHKNGRQPASRDAGSSIRRELTGDLTLRLWLHRETIHRVVAEHHAAHPRVFGSVARGEANATSDVDVLVDFTAEASLLDETGLRLALTDLLNIEVDVVASDTLRGRLRERVLREARPL